MCWCLKKNKNKPKLKPRNSLSRAVKTRDRRVPGSLSWIMAPSTPKVKLRPANPGYPGPEVPSWKEGGTISINFPTVRNF